MLDLTISVNKNMLAHYLAGLILGDGSIIVSVAKQKQAGIKKVSCYTVSPGPLLLKSVKLKKGNSEIYLGAVKDPALHPSYVSGFVDGEGSFSVSILKRGMYKTGYNIKPVFTLNLHSRDTVLLNRIQYFFGVGKITIRSKNRSVYLTVGSLKDLTNVIIPHFENFPLLTKKQADYELFKEIAGVMYNKQHLGQEGLTKVVKLKTAMNKGLTPILSENFPDIKPVERPSIKLQVSLDPNWVAGFVEAEGCFFITTIKSKLYKTGYQIKLNFNIVQHSRDIILMKSLVNYFNCGAVYENTDHVTFVITKLLDIQDKVIPFFEKYPLQGFKLQDFDKFCRVATLMEKKAHLTAEGIDAILKIKSQ